MSLVSINLPQMAIDQLFRYAERITIAIEKIAGPDLPAHKLYKATEKDLLVATPGHVESRAKETANLALKNNVMPKSEAALNWVEAMEADIIRQMPGVAGERAIADLPWRRVQRAEDI